MEFNSIPEILEDIRAGRMVVMLDDEDRENEGDLIMAASLVRPEDVNFMARFGRGLICLSLTRERCKQLSLPLMVRDTDMGFRTNFTVSIEAAEGVSTGISAYDRALTIRTAVKPDATSEDLIQPGHVFPLMAQPGGVLARAGHTESGVDLALLAGLEPAAVLVEVLREDGSMARRPDLEEFAKTHGLKMGTVADLIRYRLQHEKTIEPVYHQEVQTDHGPFELHAYRDSIYNRLHWALMRGKASGDESFLVRVHVPDLLGDVMGIQRKDLGMPLDAALAEIDRQGSGLALVLGWDHDDEDNLDRLARREARPSNEEEGDNRAARELRTYGIGAQIISDLGVRRMRVLSAPKRIHALAGFGLEVDEYVLPGGYPDS